MEKRKTYKTPFLEIREYQAEDIITISNGGTENKNLSGIDNITWEEGAW